MPWRQAPMKDVDHCDKPRGAVNRRYIRGCPNGETPLNDLQGLADESIVGQREPGELKHLSTQRKREYSASSGERTRNSPNHSQEWGCRSGRRDLKLLVERC